METKMTSETASPAMRKTPVAPRRGQILTLLMMLPLLSMLAAPPGFGCAHFPSLTVVDDALSKNTLSAADQTKAMELRVTMANLLEHGDNAAAAKVEAQIMDIMGLKLQPSRGCGSWVPKAS
jgi:hypothetical protein